MDNNQNKKNEEIRIYFALFCTIIFTSFVILKTIAESDDKYVKEIQMPEITNNTFNKHAKDLDFIRNYNLEEIDNKIVIKKEKLDELEEITKNNYEDWRFSQKIKGKKAERISYTENDLVNHGISQTYVRKYYKSNNDHIIALTPLTKENDFEKNYLIIDRIENLSKEKKIDNTIREDDGVIASRKLSNGNYLNYFNNTNVKERFLDYFMYSINITHEGYKLLITKILSILISIFSFFIFKSKNENSFRSNLFIRRYKEEDNESITWLKIKRIKKADKKEVFKKGEDILNNTLKLKENKNKERIKIENR